VTLRYEINPPKISGDSLSDDNNLKLLSKVKLRVSEISSLCNGIHFTDSVLGTRRISPITTGTLIRKNNQKIEITASLRVRDKKLALLEKLLQDAVLGGLNGVLVLKGDPSPNEHTKRSKTKSKGTPKTKEPKEKEPKTKEKPKEAKPKAKEQKPKAKEQKTKKSKPKEELGDKLTWK